MRTRRRVKFTQSHAGATALSICVLVACGTSSTSSPSGGGGGGVDAGSDVRTASGKKSIPADLRSFEANGEGMCEAPATPDWQTCQDILAQANGTWATLKPVLLADGANANSISQIESLLAKYTSDVKQTAVRDAETDANSMNALIPDFFDLYDFAVPSDTLRLDAAYRFVEIQGEHSDWATASTGLDKTKAVWARLRPLVATRAGQRTDIAAARTVIADVDATFDAIAAAIIAKSSPDTMKAATRGLDLVDVLEQTFQ